MSDIEEMVEEGNGYRYGVVKVDRRIDGYLASVDTTATQLLRSFLDERKSRFMVQAHNCPRPQTATWPEWRTKMDNVTDFPKRDLIAEMTGPQQGGCAVIIDGRVVPNMVMYDRGHEIEFMLDNRLVWGFPRDVAWNAASFAFAAMALGAGFAHPSAMHYTQRPFAPQAVGLGELPKA